MKTPLSELHVIAVRYLNDRYISGKEIPLDAYINGGIYQAANIPYQISEPFLREEERTSDKVTNIGIVGGKIAEEVAAAIRDGKAVLMTGGNCCHMTGVVGGLQDVHGPGVRIGLVWFDAHGDFNTANTTLSGMLGGMPVAVAAGLTYPEWRKRSHIVSPVPTERILLVDVRNLDPDEKRLIEATEAVIAAPASGFPGQDLRQALDNLVKQVDLIYLHVDADVLDEAYTPNHWTKEPGGPNMEQVAEAIDMVMSTGKVAVYAVVSVSGKGGGAEIMVQSGMALIQAGLASWSKYGRAKLV